MDTVAKVTVSGMRSEYSRVAFAALDNLIADHYIQCMREKHVMSFSEAVLFLTEDGTTLLQALDDIQYILDNGGIEILSEAELNAFRVIVSRPTYADFGE